MVVVGFYKTRKEIGIGCGVLIKVWLHEGEAGKVGGR